MVFYFKAQPESGDYTIFMGIDKFENEELIKYGFPEDIWYARVEKRINEVVNRLNRTKVERKPDLKAEQEAVNAAERVERKKQLRDKEIEKLEKERQAEIRSYKNLMVAEKMTSNKEIGSTKKSLQEPEDDFM